MANITVHAQMTPDECGYLSKIENPEKLTQNDIDTLNKSLNNANHIKQLYICKNGSISIVRFQYKGGFKDLKDKEGKFYSRMKTKKRQLLDEISRTMKWVDLNIPWDEYEVVNEYKNPNYQPAKIQYEKENRDCFMPYHMNTPS